MRLGLLILTGRGAHAAPGDAATAGDAPVFHTSARSLAEIGAHR